MHDNNSWQFAVTLGVIILGAFYNNKKSDDVRKELGGKIDGVRSELHAEIQSVRSELHSDMNLLTGKIMELIDRLAKVETK